MSAVASLDTGRMCGLAGRAVQADGLSWNVVEQGSGPVVLLVHGTAASVHSWRHVIQYLQTDHHVIAIDLPGHGKTTSYGSRDLSLDRMALGIGALANRLEIKPEIVVGHSAGSAILVHANANKYLRSPRLISFNGAFFPFGGVAGSLFSPIAKLLAFNPFLPRILSEVASRKTIERLLRDTGSIPSQEDVDCYFDLFKQPSHVAAALGMMAAWDLSAMKAVLTRVESECHFIAGENDKAVPPQTSQTAAALCRGARISRIAGYGHLLHESDPALAARLIMETNP